MASAGRDDGVALVKDAGLPRLDCILFGAALAPSADTAFGHACLVANRCAATLLAYHAAEIPSPACAGDGSPEARARARERVEDLERRFGSLASTSLLVQEDVLATEVDIALLRAVRKHEPDLVVMSTHSCVGLAHACLGGVTERMLEHRVRPLLCVPPSARSARPYRRILVPVDHSESSLKALPWAALLAEAFEGTVIAMHAVRPPTITEPREGAESEAPLDAQRVGALVAPCLGSVPFELAVGIAAPAWSAIVHAAREHKADLVVMASHGRSRVGDTVRGSTIERVLRHSVLPVLVT